MEISRSIKRIELEIVLINKKEFIIFRLMFL